MREGRRREGGKREGGREDGGREGQRNEGRKGGMEGSGRGAVPKIYSVHGSEISFPVQLSIKLGTSNP